ncbi:MAG: hypothetical protein BWY54_00100 [Candidatus Dependentiae bacterium ADurb.Bin331]|nr:MAG: hypothetical protein BWY54_00100 [Candidatus Dependentiae bacterium ADurb.Bin331]
MKHRTFIFFIFSTVATCATLTITLLCIASLLTPTQLTFSIDPCVTPATSQLLITTARSAHQKIQHEPWYFSLKRQFPFINEIICSRYKPHQLYVNIHIDLPYFLVNDERVLTRRGCIASCSFFEKQYLTLPGINIIQPKQELDHRCLQWLQRVPQKMFQLYEITIENRTSILVSDRMKTCMTIKMDSNQLLDQAIINRCIKMQAQLTEQKKFKKTSPAAWIADVRFNKQIVIYQKGRKENEGQRFL